MGVDEAARDLADERLRRLDSRATGPPSSLPHSFVPLMLDWLPKSVTSDQLRAGLQAREVYMLNKRAVAVSFIQLKVPKLIKKLNLHLSLQTFDDHKEAETGKFIAVHYMFDGVQIEAEETSVQYASRIIDEFHG